MFANTLISVVLATLISCVGAQNITTGALGNASIVTNNPPGPIYVATLPTTEFNNPKDPRGNVKGTIAAKANPDGIGVSFSVSFSNLPTSGGPFVYHLHDQPVPDDGNCTSTLGHLDPFVRGEVSNSLLLFAVQQLTVQTPICDATLPQTCQVGDLSGKHGKIESDPFVATYSDDFASTLPGIGAFFGNRSFVVHFANKTRISCANFVMADVTSTTSNCTSSATSPAKQTGTGTGTTTGGPAQFTGAGFKSAVSMAPLLGVAAFAFLL